MRGSDELRLDRLSRLNIDFNILAEEENCTWVNYNKKNGANAESWKRADRIEHPTTWLNTCGGCGKKSTPKKIHYRSDVAGWNKENSRDYLAECKSVLCMSCWNKIKPIVSKQEDIEENKKLLNKLNKERLKWLKSQQQAN